MQKVGTFIAGNQPLGGAYRVWNTVASVFAPPLLAVNDYVRGPNGFSIAKASGQLEWLGLPGQGNSGSAIALSSGALFAYTGDYFGQVVRTITGGAVVATNTFPRLVVNGLYVDQLVVTVKLSPSEKRLVVGTDHRDDTFLVPTRVHVLDLTAKPDPGYPEVPGSPIFTGGVSSMGGMAFAKDEKLVVAHLLSHTLRVVDLDRMSPVGAPVALPANASQPVEVVFHPSGNFVYVACRSGHVVGYNYANATMTPIKGSPWATGSTETQNLVVNNDGSLLYVLNSGDVFANRSIQPSITGFTLNTSGVLKKIGTTTLNDTNYYPTGIAMYAPAPRFTSISWSDPADIYVGTQLSSVQLNAEASVPPDTGNIVYSPPAGMILDAGAGQSLTATFTPDDPTVYVGSSRTVKINVLRLTPNSSPDISRAAPSVVCIWPPNEKLTTPITIVGVTDPDGDAVTIKITRILQDEPTNELGDANSSIDGFGVGTAQASVRNERSGLRNGRIYEIHFEASDGMGGRSSGKVFVCVPHAQNKAALDDLIRYDSTVAGGPPLAP